MSSGPSDWQLKKSDGRMCWVDNEVWQAGVGLKNADEAEISFLVCVQLLFHFFTYQT